MPRALRTAHGRDIRPRVELVPWLGIALCVAAAAGCAAPLQRVRANWEKPEHRLVGETLSPLLLAAGRDPQDCEVFFVETQHLNAAALGNCTFAFTTGLAATKDATLIRGVAAHEVAHEALAHADKQELVGAATTELVKGLAHAGGWGAIASFAILPVAAVALPAYARMQETAADTKAVEILRTARDPDPAGTMLYTLETLRTLEDVTGGDFLDTHPNITRRLDTLRDLQEPCVEPPTPEARDKPVSAVVMPKALNRPGFFPTIVPPDPRADWPERYKKLIAGAERQAQEAEAKPTTENQPGDKHPESSGSKTR